MEQITGYHSMPLTKIQIAPGIDKQNTEYGAEGRWVDADKEFIKFDGTSNSDQSSSITTDTSVGSLTGHVRVNVNGTDYWIPFYATN